MQMPVLLGLHGGNSRQLRVHSDNPDAYRNPIVEHMKRKFPVHSAVSQTQRQLGQNL